MHAALVTLSIDPAHAPAAAAAFTRDVLPRITSAPGFVAGHWLDPVDGRGFAMVLFETAEQARAAIPPGSEWTAPGVTIHGAEVRRVAVSIGLPGRD